MLLLSTILSSLVPVGVEGLKDWIAKKTGPVPQTVDEQIKLDQSYTAQLQAVAALDNPYGTPSQWVVNLRASSRYVAGLIVIVSGIGAFYTPGLSEATLGFAAEAVSIVFGFLFGQRIVARGK
jgi:hypothetical protein